MTFSKSEILYWIYGATAYIRKLFSEKVSVKVQKERKSQCLSCALFSKGDYTCGRSKLTNKTEDKVYSVKHVKTNCEECFDNSGNLAIINNEKFYRGCGCNLKNKWTFYFSKNEFNNPEKKPCPLNKWKN